jgi:hypothetical protein
MASNWALTGHKLQYFSSDVEGVEPHDTTNDLRAVLKQVRRFLGENNVDPIDLVFHYDPEFSWNGTLTYL